MTGREREGQGLAYGAGDWFVMPLADGLFVPGRVVVRRRGHATLSYLFSPSPRPPALADVRELPAGAAVMAAEVSGLRLADGTWPVLGGAEDFDADDWPVPEFETVVTSQPGGPVVQVDRFDRELRLIDRCYRPLAEAGQRQPGGAMGAGYAQSWLSRRLAEGGLLPLAEQPWWPAAVEAAARGIPGGSATGTAGSPATTAAPR